MNFKSDQKLLTVFSVSSLTDVVFLLLIFFLLSSSFVFQPGIKVQLPKAETGEQQSDRSLVVTLTEQGAIFLDTERVDVPQLGPRLAVLLSQSSDKVVVIKADRTVSLQQTVQVIDIAKAVGATRFMIATIPMGAE
ncbi:MAG TPA: biopolymer transporter ExbD [Bacteroidota bacterium]